MNYYGELKPEKDIKHPTSNGDELMASISPECFRVITSGTDEFSVECIIEKPTHGDEERYTPIRIARYNSRMDGNTRTVILSKQPIQKARTLVRVTDITGAEHFSFHINAVPEVDWD